MALTKGKEKVFRKKPGGRYSPNTDSKTYTRSDSGCTMATARLGKPSMCIENCPYDKCVFEMTVKERNCQLSRISTG